LGGLTCDATEQSSEIARVSKPPSHNQVDLMKRSVGLLVLSTVTLLCVVHREVVGQAQWTLDTVVATGTNSSGIALTPDGSKLIVTNNTNPGIVRVVSTADYAITSIDISSIENYPNAVAVTPDGSTALVATLHNIVSIELSSNSVKTHFAAPCAGTTLYGVAITPNGQSAVFPDLSSGCTQQGVRIINPANPSGSTFYQINTSGQLYGIAITPDSAFAVVTTFTSDGPKKVNLSTGSAQNITGFTESYGVASLHHSNEALVQGDSLKRVSLASNAATTFLSDIYSTALQGIAITADDRYAFVVGSFEKVVVDLASNTVIETFSAGGTAVTALADGSRFFVTDSYNGTTRVYKKSNATGVSDSREAGQVPSEVTLFQNYPNPFNPTTTIRYGLPHRAHVLLTVYNALGQRVAALVNDDIEAGYHEVRFHAPGLASSVYYYRIQAGTFTETRRLVLLR
jgi:hypothetical protein